MYYSSYKEKIMNEVNVKFKAGVERIPFYKTDGAACADIPSDENCILRRGEVKAISTGLFVEIESGNEILIRPRSGLALKNGITVLNTPGTIDEDYRDEIKVILMNLGDKDFKIKKGDRIAQMTVKPVYKINWIITSELSKSNRTGGFGSTGV
jgi:dUTP pyrophosphatase